jgi:hypothetical protein
MPAMADRWESARERAGSIVLGVLGTLMVAAAIWIVDDRDATASSLVLMGSAIVVVAVLLPRLVGRFKLGPLEAELKAVEERVEAVRAKVQELSHTTDALLVKLAPAVEHDEALPITPKKGSEPSDDG